MRIYTCEPSTEVSGEVVIGFVDNIQGEEFRPFLEKQGLTNPQADQWYPLQKLMDIFNEMQTRGGSWSNFVALGVAVAEHSVKPDAAVTLVQTLEMWDEFYQVNHRNGKITRVETVKHQPKNYSLVFDLNHNYPHDFVYGMIYGTCRNLLPKGTKFTVRYDEFYAPTNPNADKVIIHIEWS